MRANELQIGDLVFVGGIPRKVCSITKKKIGYHREEYASRLFYARMYEVFPIHLTAEILEKNGFILRGKTYILKWRGAEIHWRKTDGYAGITAPSNLKLGGWCSISNGYFCYVHILQHALRLCGLTDLADSLKV